MKRFLLDTNLLVGFTRGTPWAIQGDSRFALSARNTLTFISVISQGELLALAAKWGGGGGRLGKMEAVLRRFPVLGIQRRAIVDAYAAMDAWTHGRGPNRHGCPPPRPARTMGQNDLWIAATAHATRATLLSTDRDFAHLKDIWFAFEYIEQNPGP